MATRVRLSVVVSLLLVLASGQARTQPQSAARITTPRDAFGAAIGDDYFLATLPQFEAYWKTLDSESDRMALADIGPTEEGRRQWMAIVTAPENFRKLNRYKEISRRLARAEGLTDEAARALAAEGKAVVWIDGGLHASEVLGVQQLIETVYQLVSRDDDETRRILRDVIVLAVHANPDGHDLVGNWYMRETDPLKRRTTGFPRLYQKYAGHDNNRDFYMAALAETININRVLYQEWFPQIVYDHHQSGPAGTVMFAPPFRDPMNPVIDPLVAEGIELVGRAMHSRFAAEGKAGVTMRRGGTYSTWWNGGLRTTAYFHNQIGLLTETAGNPTPMQIASVPARQVASADLPYPIAPQTWHFRQSIDYSLTANRAVLDVASQHREALLFNVYRMGKNSIERGSRDSWTDLPHRPLNGAREPRLRDARGYVIPADQADFATATTLVNALLSNGITVHRATRAFSVNGRRYPAGSYVVKTAQAFRPHVLDMFEPQDHPDDFASPGGAPIPPYDSAGWTLALQMGIAFDRVLDGFDGPFEIIDGPVATPPGRVWLPPSGGRAVAGYLVSHRPNNAFAAVNRLVKAGERVYWPVRRAGLDGPPDAMYVAAQRSTLPILRTAASELGLTFTGVSAVPAGEALALRPVRVGLADTANGAVSSGWIRWILERYEFPFDVVLPQAIEGGELGRYDVVILSDDVVPDERATPGLKQFVEAGGTLVAIGRATGVGARLGLPVSNPLVDATGQALPREKYFVPASILRATVDATVPAAYGFDREANVFFDNSPVFTLAADAASRGIRPIAWFATDAPLRSGWAWGQAYLKDTVAALEAPLGKGRVLLFGPEVTFRAQSHGTFKFLFNSIYYGSASPARLH